MHSLTARLVSYYFHGTSSLFLRSILKKGLIFNSKKRLWTESKDPKLESFPGVYFTPDLGKASISAQNTYQTFGGELRQAVA